MSSQENIVKLPAITKAKEAASKLGFLEFNEASMTPEKRGHYVVINEQLEYVYCTAHILDDGQFCYFLPSPNLIQSSPDHPAARLYGNKVIAWAKLPDPRDVIHTLFPTQ